MKGIKKYKNIFFEGRGIHEGSERQYAGEKGSGERLTWVLKDLVVLWLQAGSDSWLLAFKCWISHPRKSCAEFRHK